MSIDLLSKFADYPIWFKYTESFFLIGFVIFTIIGLLFLKPINKEPKIKNPQLQQGIQNNQNSKSGPALIITGDAKGNIFDRCSIGETVIEKNAQENKFINSGNTVIINQNINQQNPKIINPKLYTEPQSTEYGGLGWLYTVNSSNNLPTIDETQTRCDTHGDLLEYKDSTYSCPDSRCELKNKNNTWFKNKLEGAYLKIKKEIKDQTN